MSTRISAALPTLKVMSDLPSESQYRLEGWSANLAVNSSTAAACVCVKKQKRLRLSTAICDQTPLSLHSVCSMLRWSSRCKASSASCEHTFMFAVCVCRLKQSGKQPFIITVSCQPGRRTQLCYAAAGSASPQRVTARGRGCSLWSASWPRYSSDMRGCACPRQLALV